MYDERGKPIDVVPEHIARKRGMEYALDRHGKVCEARAEDVLLVDQLYKRKTISGEHHFHGVQLITMRKVFLSPVGFKVGMLRVQSEGDEPPAPPVPVVDTDYLRVLRAVKNVASQRLLREVCDEEADPRLYQLYGRQGHLVRQAFDALCDAVRALRELKKGCADRGCRACDGSCTAARRPAGA